MATYLPNSNDYIPKSKSYTPDFKFLADVLGRRQDRYNTNYKQLNELYGKVVHADLSHEDNIHKRDEYANLIVPKIQQITGTDFSLQQNADAARALFKPFFEDKKLVRDIVYTKRYGSQMQIAENQKNNSELEERRKYFEDGVKRLQYGMQDFKEGSLDDIMTAQMPEYVENPDLVNRAIEHLKNWGGEGKGLEISDIVFSADNKWMITQTNGALLTHKPTGIEDPESGEMIYYNPAANYITTTMGGDPLIARGYATSAYVKAREFGENEDNIAKYGSSEAAERFWMSGIIDKTKVKTTEIIAEEEKQKIKAEKTKNSWANYLKTNPNQNSDEQQDYINALSSIAAIDAGVEASQKVLSDISRSGEDIEDLRNIYYQAFMHQSLSMDILSAASQYATLTKKITKRELNPIYSKQLDFEYKKALKQIDFDNAKALADYKKEQENIGLDLGGGGGLTSKAPDAALNLDSYAQEDDKIGADNEFIRNLSDRPIEKMLRVVEQAYGDLGPGWSDEDNVFNSTGMEVEVFKYTDKSRGEGVETVEFMTDGNPEGREGKWETKFMTWTEAKEYFLGQGRDQEDLNNAYQDVLKRYYNKIENDPNMSKPMFDQLNTLISNVESEIKNDKLTVIELIENQQSAMAEAYKMVLRSNPKLDDWMDENNISMFDGDRLVTLTEFNKEYKRVFRERVKALDLPKEIKSFNEIKKTVDYRQPYSVALAKYSNYIAGIFTPEKIKAAGFKDNGMGAQMMLQTFYAINPEDVGGAYMEAGTKPGNVSDEVWRKSVQRAADNQSRNFLKGNAKNMAKMVLQDDIPFSKLYDDSKTAYNNIYNAMNQGMVGADANAQNGFPTYDAKRDYMLKTQGDDGSISMTDNWTGSYWHGASKPDVTNQVKQAFTLLNKLDKSYTSVQTGTPSEHGESGVIGDMDWDDNMAELIDQITMDLSNTQEVDKAHRPNMQITYNENVHGKSAITIQLDQKYVNKLRSNTTDNKLLALGEMKNNTFTIYIDKDRWDNPMNMDNIYVSRTKREIKTNGQFYNEVPEGGYIKAWTGSDGNVYTQMTMKKYNFKTKKYEDINTVTEILDEYTDRQIDALMETVRKKLNKIAEENRIAKDKDTK